jgi:hypothetical protein
MTAPNPRRRSRNWLWFFGILLCLTVTAVVLEVTYNLRQQLRPEQIAAARERWHEHRPDHYQLNYTIKRKDAAEQRYSVTVRAGEVVSVQGRSGDYPFDSMDALFDFMEKRLQVDRQPGAPQVFVTAVFAPQDGRVLRYIRSVRKTGERMEVIVSMRALS